MVYNIKTLFTITADMTLAEKKKKRRKKFDSKLCWQRLHRVVEAKIKAMIQPGPCTNQPLSP